MSAFLCNSNLSVSRMDFFFELGREIVLNSLKSGIGFRWSNYGRAVWAFDISVGLMNKCALFTASLETLRCPSKNCKTHQSKPTYNCI